MGVPIFIAGPTAVGKSAMAIELVKAKDGEIISVDSMQVYRGLDIGTAKPTKTELESATHHLIDVVELTESFDAATFVEKARAVQGKTPPLFFVEERDCTFRRGLRDWENPREPTRKSEKNLRA